MDRRRREGKQFPSRLIMEQTFLLADGNRIPQREMVCLSHMQQGQIMRQRNQAKLEWYKN